MPGVGEDIKSAYEETGAGFTILRDAGDLSGEFLDATLNDQITKPFIREHFLECNFAYNTSGEVGDVVRFDETRDNYLVMNQTPDVFENEIIEYNVVLYKANVSGEILRPSGEVRDGQLHKQTQWQIVKTNAYALQTDAFFGGDLDTEQDLGIIGIENDELYIPANAGIEVMDRWQPASGEYYRVESISRRRFPAVYVVKLGEDQR